MKRFIVCVLLALSVSAASAATVVTTNANGYVVTTVDGIATVTIPAGTAGSVVYGAYYSQTVTNGQAVTLVADTINVLTGTGQATGLTNTITFANFAAADVGKLVTVAAATGSTNAIAVDTTGNYYGPAKALAAGQKMDISVGATNVIYGP